MAIVKGSKDGVYIRLQYALSSPAGVPYAALSSLADGFTLEGGTYDPATAIVTQTAAAAALGIPDLAGVAQDWVFTKVAQTLVAKTLTAPAWTGALTGSSTCSIVMGNGTVSYTADFSTNSLVLSATDNAGAKLILGTTGTNGLDITIQGVGTATIAWDAALGTLTFGAAAYVRFPTNQANGLAFQLPVKTTTGNPGTAGTPAGAFAYNSFDAKLMVFDGSAWKTAAIAT